MQSLGTRFTNFAGAASMLAALVVPSSSSVASPVPNHPREFAPPSPLPLSEVPSLNRSGICANPRPSPSAIEHMQELVPLLAQLEEQGLRISPSLWERRLKNYAAVRDFLTESGVNFGTGNADPVAQVRGALPMLLADYPSLGVPALSYLHQTLEETTQAFPENFETDQTRATLVQVSQVGTAIATSLAAGCQEAPQQARQSSGGR